MEFIDTHREGYGVEPICREVQVAPSTYYEHKRIEAHPAEQSTRRKRDHDLTVEIERVWKENRCVYGVRKVWRQLKRESFPVARCTVQRLMKRLGIQGAVRGRRCKTTFSDLAAASPQDLVKRQFTASRPNQLWVADFTYVATWTGFVYVAFVTDVFSRKIVGWRAAKSMNAQLPLDALDQALWARAQRA